MLVATAGHVDHGKTTLVAALTGVDTDRLPEEKARGLTIDLGFAYRTLDDGHVLGFVDVPGHERFVRNMIAGVPAIDVGLLVVAADDGPMPQTREHLAVLDLLGISRGIVALTKSDVVDAARLAEVTDEVHSVLDGTGLAGAPVLAVSAHTGAGLDALQSALEEAAAATPPRSGAGGFRLAVDRAFTVRGAGLVVTGAVYAGQVAVGDRLRLVPGDLEARVRGIRALDRESATGRAGERCALNLAGAGIERAAVHRGQWLVTPELDSVSAHLDARLHVLPGAPRALGHWTPVHVHHGAASVPARIATLDARAVEPGGEALVQLVLEQPVHAVAGDRVVVRDQSARETIAGARVLDPAGLRRGRARPERLALLRALERPDPADALTAALDAAPDGLSPDSFARARNLLGAEFAPLVASSGAVEIAGAHGRLLTTATRAGEVREALLAALDAYHAEHPDALGAELREVATLARSDALDAGPQIAAGVVGALVREGLVRRSGKALMRSGHRPRMPAEDEAAWRALSEHVGPGTLQPPSLGDLATALEMEPPALKALVERCMRRGLLVRVGPRRILHHRAIASLAEVAASLGADGERFDARAYRDRAGIGRNLTIDVLEFFDASGLTRRIGDTRTVVANARALFGESEPDGSPT